MFLMSCVYIVLPEALESSSQGEARTWSGVVTGVSRTDDGSLHIDITIRNETGAWSSMNALADTPAQLSSGGKKTHCETVFVSTGGHRLAPGFQMRGYTGGTKAEQKTQLLYVECAFAEAAPGTELEIQYEYFTGDLDYYHQDSGRLESTLVLKLDEVAADLEYPVFEAQDGLAEPVDFTVLAISENVISLSEIQRTEEGFVFTWQNENPTEFALKTHIGTPPVIGSDGVIYGWYEIMDLASVPLTPAGGKITWTTETRVPPEVSGCYILLSVESKNVRLYVSHLIDITER